MQSTKRGFAFFGRGDGIRPFSRAPRSAIINGVLCRLCFCITSLRWQSVLLSQNGSHPQIPSLWRKIKNAKHQMVICIFWSRRRDLNPRPLRPERNALPAALRLVVSTLFTRNAYIITNIFLIVNSFSCSTKSIF